MRARLRILVVAACPLPAPRGTPIRVLRTSEALARLGHEVHVATYHLGARAAEVEEPRGLALHRIRALPFYRRTAPGPSYGKLLVVDPLLAARVRRLARERPFDVVHAHHYEGLLVARLGAPGGLPIIYDAHTMLEEELPAYRMGLPGSALRRIGRVLDRSVPSRARHVIAVTATIRDRLVALGRVDPDRVTVIPNGVSAERFDATRRREPDRARPTVAYAGNLAPYQGIDMLLEAFERVRARVPTVRLLILTDAPEAFGAYWPLAARLGVEEAVEVVGARFEELPERFAEVDVAVSPRTNCPGVPQKMLNYMAAGLPIVAFRGSAGYLEAGRTALVVPDGDVGGLADAIGALLGDRARGRELGRAAAAHVRRHLTWEATARRVDRVYARVLEGR